MVFSVYFYLTSSHSGWFFSFGHSPTLYWLRTSAFKIGLPAMQRLFATHKWVDFCRLPLEGKLSSKARLMRCLLQLVNTISFPPHPSCFATHLPLKGKAFQQILFVLYFNLSKQSAFL